MVDKDTLMVSCIFNADSALEEGVPCYPQHLMEWSGKTYASVFRRLFGEQVPPNVGSFSLRENDYVLGEHKFGGNAQAISKDRFVHHTSLLWIYQHENMKLLQHPPKAPEYRKGREHTAFVCALRYLTP